MCTHEPRLGVLRLLLFYSTGTWSVRVLIDSHIYIPNSRRLARGGVTPRRAVFGVSVCCAHILYPHVIAIKVVGLISSQARSRSVICWIIRQRTCGARARASCVGTFPNRSPTAFWKFVSLQGRLPYEWSASLPYIHRATLFYPPRCRRLRGGLRHPSFSLALVLIW